VAGFAGFAGQTKNKELLSLDGSFKEHNQAYQFAAASVHIPAHHEHRFRKIRKSVHVQPESLFTLNQNGCSRSAGMGVHVRRNTQSVGRTLASSRLCTQRWAEGES